MSVRPFTAALIALLFLPTQAAGKTVIRKADQLVSGNKQLRVYAQPYILTASTSVVYSQCANILGITESQKQFFNARYLELSTAYMKAFEDAFVEQWDAPSSVALSKDYARYLRDLRAPGIEQTKKAVASLGCKHRSIKAMVDYFRAIQSAEAKGQKVPLVQAVRKKKPR